jgi:hypothetical protein
MRERIIASLGLLILFALGAFYVRWPHVIQKRTERWLAERPRPYVLKVPLRFQVPFIRAVGVIAIAAATYYLFIIWTNTRVR